MNTKTRYSIMIVAIILFACVLLVINMNNTEKVNIIDILNSPKKYEGKEVVVNGKYFGWKIPQNLTGPSDYSPPETRSDWIVADNTGWIYVVARGASIPINISYGQEISVYAVVKIKDKNGTVVPYLYPKEIQV